MGKKARKLLGIAVAMLALSSTVKAEDFSFSSYKQGLKDGIVVGQKFAKEYLKEELYQNWKLIDSILSYKLLLLAGKVPPPIVQEKVYLVKKRNGAVEIKKDVEVLPPAYFPVDALLAEKEDLTGEPFVIPSGYSVVASTKDFPTEKIALLKFLAQQKGFSPVYVMQGDFLYFGTYQREADAKDAVKKLKETGIEATYYYQEKPIKYFVPGENDLSRLIKDLAQRILEKEKKLIGVPVRSPEVGINGVIYYLQKAIATVDTINYKAHPDFRGELLKEDLRSILNQILAYLSDKTPYKRVVVLSPEEEKETKETLEWKKVDYKAGGNINLLEKIDKIKKVLGE